MSELGAPSRPWTKCIVGHCTFEGTNEVRGIYGGPFFYCDGHLARLLAVDPTMTP